MSAKTQPAASVLVVDDDRVVREMVRDAIAGSASVECCARAEAALEALRGDPPDLVISDLTMPGLSGLELLERVRREHPSIDFVLLTANASVETAVEALRMGAADYLVKPVRGEELALVVERILAHPYTTHVRELDALLWQAMAHSKGDRIEAPPRESVPVAEASDGAVDWKAYAGRAPAEIPADALQACLDEHNGAQEEAYRALGLDSRYVLRRLIKKHGLVVRKRG